MNKSFKEWYLEKHKYIPEIDPHGQSIDDTCNDIMNAVIDLILEAFEEYEKYKKELENKNDL